MKNIVKQGIPLAKELSRKKTLAIGKSAQKMLKEQIIEEPANWIEVLAKDDVYQEINGSNIRFPIEGNEYHFMFLADTPSHGDRLTYATFMSAILSGGGRVFRNTKYNITCLSSHMTVYTIRMLLQAISENPVRLIDFVD